MSLADVPIWRPSACTQQSIIYHFLLTRFVRAILLVASLCIRVLLALTSRLGENREVYRQPDCRAKYYYSWRYSQVFRYSTWKLGSIPSRYLWRGYAGKGRFTIHFKAAFLPLLRSRQLEICPIGRLRSHGLKLALEKKTVKKFIPQWPRCQDGGGHKIP